MLIEGAALLTALGYQVNKSMKIDEQSMKKNIRAFTKTADAQKKLEYYNEMAFNKLAVNAKRKHGLLTCHLKMFQNQYAVIQKIQFKKGRGIEEIEQIDKIQDQVHQYMMQPAVVSGKAMSDSQLIVSIALRGIGGQVIQDSKNNLKLASANVSQSNVVSAQIDSMCIALDGILKHAEIVTELLEKLGMLYMKSIKNITRILEVNGMNSDHYSDEDIEAINVSLLMTKLIYRIINTPLINADGKIEQESVKVIADGNKLLEQINGGK